MMFEQFCYCRSEFTHAQAVPRAQDPATARSEKGHKLKLNALMKRMTCAVDAVEYDHHAHLTFLLFLNELR